MTRLSDRTIVGAAERVELPEWGVRLRAKIDTGAKTSAIHAEDVEELGRRKVRFSIVTSSRTRAKRVRVEAKVVRRTRVRSSTGHLEERLIVATTLSVGGVDKRIQVSLTNRKGMIFRMLMGREALEGDFLVDPSRRYLHGRAPKMVKKKRRAKKSRTPRASGRRTSPTRGPAKKAKKKSSTKKTSKKKASKSAGKKTSKKKASTRKKSAAKKTTTRKKSPSRASKKKATTSRGRKGATKKRSKSASKKSSR